MMFGEADQKEPRVMSERELEHYHAIYDDAYFFYKRTKSPQMAHEFALKVMDLEQRRSLFKGLSK